MKKIIAANLKSNLTIQEIEQYITMLNSSFIPSKNLEAMVFPPAFALCLEAKSFILGVQNAYGAKNGALTGEITLDGLISLGVNCVMIGHSERRAMGESQELLAQKFSFYQEAGFRIIYCIGEDLQTHQKGQAAIEYMLTSQLDGISLDYSRLILAYEPIWAIGSGMSAKLENIRTIHHFLRQKTHLSLIYGGSVNETNLKEILSIPNVNGALIGSAALKIQNFLNMLEIAKEA